MRLAGWMLVAPFRGIARGLRRARERRSAAPRVEVDPSCPGRWTRFWAYVDEAFMQPLRDLDAAVAARLSRARHPSQEVADVQ